MITLYNDELLVVKACQNDCPLDGIPISEYMGKGVCKQCKYFSVRKKAHQDWEESRIDIDLSYNDYKAIKEAYGLEFFFEGM